jgi:hypothetical protein
MLAHAADAVLDIEPSPRESTVETAYQYRLDADSVESTYWVA